MLCLNIETLGFGQREVDISCLNRQDCVGNWAANDLARITCWISQNETEVIRGHDVFLLDAVKVDSKSGVLGRLPEDAPVVVVRCFGFQVSCAGKGTAGLIRQVQHWVSNGGEEDGVGLGIFRQGRCTEAF